MRSAVAGVPDVDNVLAAVGVHAVAGITVIAVIPTVACANSVSEVSALDSILVLLRCALTLS